MQAIGFLPVAEYDSGEWWEKRHSNKLRTPRMLKRMNALKH